MPQLYKRRAFQPKLSRNASYGSQVWIGVYYGLPIYFVFEEVIARELSKELTSTLNWSERGCFSPSSPLVAGIAWGWRPELWPVIASFGTWNLILFSLLWFVKEGPKTLSQSFVTQSKGIWAQDISGPFQFWKAMSLWNKRGNIWNSKRSNQ